MNGHNAANIKMKSIKNNILVVNGGSSSIKFAIYQVEDKLIQKLWGSIENIGLKNASFNFTNTTITHSKSILIKINNFKEAVNYLIDWLELQDHFISVKAIGHRVVHGMEHTKAEKITSTLLNQLKQIKLYDPEHLPGEIELIEIFAKRYPALVQIACFDTAFHSTMPTIAKLLSIPRKYYDKGIHRYGFHGLSYAYLLQELHHNAGAAIANGKIILAHLGNGASIAAIKNGKCQDTSMGFTPTSGLIMSTRSGDLDPGVAWYLMEVEKLTVQQFNCLINQESGLLGISGTSADMKELIKNKSTDAHAAEAFELFCYQTKKFIGSYAAVLNGLDTLVFSGGIGEHSPDVRSRVCDDLNFLGIEIDEIRNRSNELIISSPSSKVTVRVMTTNEQLMIAKMVSEVMNYSYFN